MYVLYKVLMFYFPVLAQSMFQMCYLQHDLEHENLQGIQQDSLLQCVSRSKKLGHSHQQALYQTPISYPVWRLYTLLIWRAMIKLFMVNCNVSYIILPLKFEHKCVFMHIWYICQNHFPHDHVIFIWNKNKWELVLNFMNLKYFNNQSKVDCFLTWMEGIDLL